MAEWLYEDGIGEARAALVDGGRIVAAALEPEGSGPRAGTVAAGRLISAAANGLSTALLDSGVEVLLERVPPGVSEGSAILVRIVREAIPEPGRAKRAKAVIEDEGALAAPGPSLLARITETGHPVRICHAHEPDAFEDAGWSELLDEAENGEIAFLGGALRLSVTPAMTLFDVDGSLNPAKLAVAAASAVAEAIMRHDIGGSIGVDFPTLPDKAARQAAADAFDAALPQPFERTAINGFGFMQVVRRRIRASLPEMVRADPVGAALRARLRQLERDRAGTVEDLPTALRQRLAAHPDWLEALARRTGRAVQAPGKDEGE